MLKLNQKYLAEFLGTFALVFIGAGAVVVDGHTGTSHGLAEAGKLGLLGIAVAHGLTLTAMIYAVGSISGAHFNPAITLAAWVRRRISSDLVAGYIAAQLVGALVASLVLAMIFPDEVGLAQLGTPALGPRISSLQGFAIESAITFLLTVVVLTSTRSNNQAFAGLAIGGTLTGIILFAGPLTGAAANPARYLGPAIVSRNIDDIWLYLMAPLFGAALAAFVTGFAIDKAEPEPAEADAEEEGHEPDEPVGSIGARRSTPEAAHEALEESESTSDAVKPNALKAAQELYWGGEAEKAATVLVPLLKSASQGGESLSGEVRSLIMVIEDACGRLAILDSYRAMLDPSGGEETAAQASAPPPAEPPQAQPLAP
jgi:aquaporin NIP